MVDIVSKNGNLLLNITQKSDGTIEDYAAKFLMEMAQWMKINGEAIHGTRPWEIYGEGPVKITNGEQKKSQRLAYTAEDIRFTTRGNCLYALIMDWPKNQVIIKSLPKGKKLWFGEIRKVEMLGVKGALKWQQTSEGLKVEIPEKAPCSFVYTLKIY